jgi:hypothetical protein
METGNTSKQENSESKIKKTGNLTEEKKKKSEKRAKNVFIKREQERREEP